MGRVTYDFDDETVVVTGGSAGIGRAVARRFGAAGAHVINADQREDPKAEGEDVPTHDVIAEEGGSAEYVETNVSDREDLESVVEGAHEHGGVDVMVNNAGMQNSGPFLEVDPAEFEQLHDVNAKGVYFGTQVAANDMLDRDDPGVIVNTASISSEDAQHDQVQYDSTKGAIKMITRGAALELAEHGIRVNAVAPGQIATEFSEGWSEEAQEAAGEGGGGDDGFLKPVPLARAGFPDDLDGSYLFLASEEADYITGQLLYVDGGWTAI
ncbi:short-chain dehydrogenase [Halobacteriales archaeon QS_8_65_32]|jgi:NAD(P)-dependent dehydrogenase (short-subunit alcohol dehydrogenase family)|nr:MAG: short-chain dehydrogenase [Halobacteriales archaeon QS_8_65_32]